jgi:sugar transferase (PEP-CTERM system associated)
VKIFAHHIAPQVLLIAAVDFAVGLASLYLAYFVVHSAGFASAVGGGPHLFLRAVVLALCLMLSMAAMGLYHGQLRYRIEGVLARMIVGVGFAAVAIAMLEFLFRFVDSRPVWVIALGVSAVLLGTGRAVFAGFVDGGEVFRRRVLVYGAGKRASRILELRRRSDQRGFRVVAFVPAAGDTHVIDDSRVVSHDVCPLQEYVREHQVDEIVVALDDRRKSFPVADLLACKLAGTRVVDLLEFLERETGRVKVDMVNPAWLIFSSGFNRTGGGLSFRALDLAFATLFCLGALPVGLLVALAILLDDGGPVLYRQRRVGLEGKEFLVYKFRSMRNGAETNGHAQWAAREDSRVTAVGKWLRKFRLDELPQLINVFKGDMSFVGPRPERPEFVKELACRIPYYHERHCVKPGLTGWAQLCYPYGASEEDSQAKLEFDMYYVKHRSLVFNLMILLQTVEVVLWQKGSR